MSSKKIDGEDNSLDIIKADNDFLKGMINLIPPKFYFKQDQLNEALSSNADDEEQSSQNGKRKREKDLSEKGKNKRAKFDPTQIRTVTKIQDLVHAPKEDSDAPKKSKKKTENLESVEVKSSTENLEDLRARIQEKIKTMKAKRNALGKDDYLEKKRLKKQLGRMKMKIQQANKKSNKGGEHKGAPVTNGLGSPKHGPPKAGIINSDGKLVFSKFDFSEAEKPKKGKAGGRKNFTKLLEKVNQDKEKLETLKETDKEKAKKVQEKTAWQTALQKAQGIKVRDDPNMLKKSIKKQEQKKRKTQKEWKEREDKVEKKMQDRQDKRKKNIQAKKQSRIDKKIKKAKKKGRIIPGF